MTNPFPADAVREAMDIVIRREIDAHCPNGKWRTGPATLHMALGCAIEDHIAALTARVAELEQARDAGADLEECRRHSCKRKARLAALAGAEPVAWSEVMALREQASPVMWEVCERGFGDADLWFTPREQWRDYDGKLIRGQFSLADARFIAAAANFMLRYAPHAPAKAREDEDLLRALYDAAAKGFHTSETCGPDRKYLRVSKFQNMDDLHAYEDAWLAVMLAAKEAAA